MTDLEELKRLAEAAGNIGLGAASINFDAAPEIDGTDYAAFIAAANPAAVLDLIVEVERLRDLQGRAVTAIQELIDSHKRDTKGECDEHCDIVCGMEAARDAVIESAAPSVSE